MKMTIKSSLLTLGCTFLISKDTFFSGRPWSLHREDTVHHWSQTWSHLLSQLCHQQLHTVLHSFLYLNLHLYPPLKIKGTHIQTYKVKIRAALTQNHIQALSAKHSSVSASTQPARKTQGHIFKFLVSLVIRVSCSRLETCSVHRMLFSLGLAITSIKKATTLIQWGVTSLSRQAGGCFSKCF